MTIHIVTVILSNAKDRRVINIAKAVQFRYHYSTFIIQIICEASADESISFTLPLSFELKRWSIMAQ